MSGSEDNYRVSSDRPFLLVLAVLGGSYLFLIAAMVVADLIFLDYRDHPVFGPEIVEASRYPGDASGVKNHFGVFSPLLLSRRTKRIGVPDGRKSNQKGRCF